MQRARVGRCGGLGVAAVAVLALGGCFGTGAAELEAVPSPVTMVLTASPNGSFGSEQFVVRNVGTKGTTEAPRGAFFAPSGFQSSELLNCPEPLAPGESCTVVIGVQSFPATFADASGSVSVVAGPGTASITVPVVIKAPPGG